MQTIVTANILYEKEQTQKVSAYFQSAIIAKCMLLKLNSKNQTIPFWLQPIFARTINVSTQHVYTYVKIVGTAAF